MRKVIYTDVAVIGAGTAGLFALHHAMKSGAKALAFDPGPLGTTCARVGCMPSKLLIAAAEAAHSAREAGVFGVKTGVKIDGAKVMKRVRLWRDRFVGGMMEEYDGLVKKKLLIKEKARFTGPHTLEAGGKTYKFKAAVVATGSVTIVPPPLSRPPRIPAYPRGDLRTAASAWQSTGSGSRAYRPGAGAGALPPRRPRDAAGPGQAGRTAG